MQVFRVYLKLIKKSIPSLLVYFGIMLLVITISTANQGGSNKHSFKVTKVDCAFVDHQDGEEKIIPFLKEYLKNYCNFMSVGTSNKELDDALFYDKVDYILIVDKNFEQEFLAGEDVTLSKRGVAGSEDGFYVDQLINNFLSTFRQYQGIFKEESVDSICKMTMDTLKDSAKANLVADEEKAYSKQYSVTFFNILTYVLVTGLMTGIGFVMVSFNNIHIKRRNVVSPVSNQSMNVQMIFANLIFALLYLSLTVIVGIAFGPGGIDGNSLGLHILNSIAFTLCGLGMAYIVGIAVKKVEIITSINTVLSLVLAFISGAFVPQEYLDDMVLSAAKFTPNYWCVLANNKIGEITSFSAQNVREILGVIGIELLFAFALFAIAIVVSRQRRQLTE